MSNSARLQFRDAGALDLDGSLRMVEIIRGACNDDRGTSLSVALQDKQTYLEWFEWLRSEACDVRAELWSQPGPLPGSYARALVDAIGRGAVEANFRSASNPSDGRKYSAYVGQIGNEWKASCAPGASVLGEREAAVALFAEYAASIATDVALEWIGVSFRGPSLDAVMDQAQAFEATVAPMTYRSCSFKFTNSQKALSGTRYEHWADKFTRGLVLTPGALRSGQDRLLSRVRAERAKIKMVEIGLTVDVAGDGRDSYLFGGARAGKGILRMEIDGNVDIEKVSAFRARVEDATGLKTSLSYA